MAGSWSWGVVKSFFLLVCLVFLIGANSAAAITFTIGDNDGFASQSAAEAAAANGAQFTDLSNTTGTTLTTVPVIFNFSPFLTITNAVFSVRALGIQSNDTDPNTLLSGEDGLTLDGVLVPEFFAGVDQGQSGVGTISQVLDSSFFASLADGTATFAILMNSLAGTGTPFGEPVAFDFFELTIDGTPVSAVPVPAALPLFATGLGILALLGWRRKRLIGAKA